MSAHEPGAAHTPAHHPGAPGQPERQGAAARQDHTTCTGQDEVSLLLAAVMLETWGETTDDIQAMTDAEVHQWARDALAEAGHARSRRERVTQRFQTGYRHAPELRAPAKSGTRRLTWPDGRRQGGVRREQARPGPPL